MPPKSSVMFKLWCELENYMKITFDVAVRYIIKQEIIPVYIGMHPFKFAPHI